MRSCCCCAVGSKALLTLTGQVHLQFTCRGDLIPPVPDDEYNLLAGKWDVLCLMLRVRETELRDFYTPEAVSSSLGTSQSTI